jgi:hypothetical protein
MENPPESNPVPEIVENGPSVDEGKEEKKVNTMVTGFSGR